MDTPQSKIEEAWIREKAEEFASRVGLHGPDAATFMKLLVAMGYASSSYIRRHLILPALETACRYGGTDEAHHKTWVIDQMVRALAGEDYNLVVTEMKAGEGGPETYKWDEGIAP